MHELLRHIEQDNIIELYRDDSVIRFNEILRTIYIIIRRAALDEADKLILNHCAMSHYRNDLEIGAFGLTDYPDLPIIFRRNLHKLLEVDQIVSRYLHIVSEDSDTLTCKLHL